MLLSFRARRSATRRALTCLRSVSLIERRAFTGNVLPTKNTLQ